jgi:hypothetical protein
MAGSGSLDSVRSCIGEILDVFQDSLMFVEEIERRLRQNNQLRPGESEALDDLQTELDRGHGAIKNGFGRIERV